MEERIKHLWVSSLVLPNSSRSSDRDIEALRCHYRLLCMLSDEKIANLPSINFGTESMCQMCGTRWCEGSFSLKTRKFHLGKRLRRLLRSSKPLSKYQQQLVNLATSEMEGSIYQHCNICQNSVALKYRRPEKRNDEDSSFVEMKLKKRKKKKKKSDKFAGLEPSLVLKAKQKLSNRKNSDSGSNWSIDSSVSDVSSNHTEHMSKENQKFWHIHGRDNSSLIPNSGMKQNKTTDKLSSPVDFSEIKSTPKCLESSLARSGKQNKKRRKRTGSTGGPMSNETKKKRISLVSEFLESL